MIDMILAICQIAIVLFVIGFFELMYCMYKHQKEANKISFGYLNKYQDQNEKH